MTGLTRRAVLASAGAAVAVAGVPGAVRASKLPLDGAKAREAMELFGQLNPHRQGVSLTAMRMFLKTQRGHESQGLTEAEVQAALRRQMEAQS